MLRELKVGFLLLCLLATLTATGCGGDEATTREAETDVSRSTKPPKAAPKPEKNAKGNRREPVKPKPQAAKAKPKGAGDASSGSKNGSAQPAPKPQQSADGGSPDLTDEQACAQDPAQCRDTTPTPAADSSSPDIHEAEQHEEGSSKPKCHSQDCEEAR